LGAGTRNILFPRYSLSYGFVKGIESREESVILPVFSV
jgi:hypothetical protein